MIKIEKEEFQEDVYDITVPETNCFYGNGILVHNCVEIGFYCVDEKTGLSGWQGCNLTEINGEAIKSLDDFCKASYYAAALGTLQAGYTDFKFVSEATKNIFEREALIGVSVTGWLSNPEILLSAENQKVAASHVLQANEDVARMIGINLAARTTCTKPSGTVSILLETSAGIHPNPAKKYIRHMQMNKEGEVVQAIKKLNPYMVEESSWSTNNTDYVVAFPVITKDNVYTNNDVSALQLLDYVKTVQQNWVEFGTRKDVAVDPRVRHNVSNTIHVKENEWDDVEEFIYQNRHVFTGIAILPHTGDRDYAQAPNTSLKDADEILKEYGVASMFASGLIVDATHGFKNLWEACAIAVSSDYGTAEDRDNRSDWIRRFHKFAENYFEGDLQKTSYLLKDVFILHKWQKIQQNFVDVDLYSIDIAKKYIDIDTTGSAACVGTAEGCLV